MQAQTKTPTALDMLAAYLRGGNLPHALLIECRDSEAAFVFAREIARGAMCTGESRPCGVCKNCVKNEKGVHPDVLVYSGGAGARSFHIDTVREIRQEAYVRAGEAPCKALILRDTQNLSAQAQNALLKVIEEPPRGALFLLTCEDRSALLETVLSRVTALSLRGGERAEADEWQALQLLTDLCIGSELDALALLASLERSRPELLDLLGRLRSAAAGLLLPGEAPASESAKRLRERINRLQLLKILAIIDEMAAGLAGNVNGPLLCTALCAKIRLALEF